MIYVALLRGINVGGKTRVEMQRLKQTFERLGFTTVKTYINSGNVIFSADEGDEQSLVDAISLAIEKDFGFAVPVLLRSFDEMEALVKGILEAWVNNEVMRCDVLFLWPAIDNPESIKRIPHKPEIEDIVYLPGAIVWRIDRDKVRRGAVPKVIGSETYRQITIRNVNTVRKLYDLMKTI